MRRGRIFFLLALIIVIAIALVYFVYSKGLLFPQATDTSEANAPVYTSTPVPTSKVVVVTQRLQRGETISADKLDFVDYQADLVLPIMYTDINQEIGRIARYTMD